MRNKWLFLISALILLFTGCKHRSIHVERVKADSLNARAYRFRYVDIDSTEALAQKAFDVSLGSEHVKPYADGQNEARNLLAFVAYQHMDFDGVDSTLAVVRQESSNPLLLLCAEVMQMKAYQRTGDGARFFQAKSRAENYIKKLSRKEASLSEHNQALWVYAQTEFHIIASTYYFYQEQDEEARAELSKVPPCMKLRVDTTQWVYYNYMLGPGGLVEGRDAKDITLQEFDYLFRAYTASRRDSLRYFEANCLQAFATMFLSNDSLIACERSDAYNLLRFQHAGENGEDVVLPMAFARRALELFRKYNDLFQTACAYRTIGEVLFEQGDYEEALESYVQALHCVNLHHLRYYGRVSLDTLSAFNPQDLERSVEKDWIQDPRIATVPEWIAGIRQQFSLTFSALDMRQASDYNRNFYLDLLQATNQDQELESRTESLKQQTQALYWRMLATLILMFIALLLVAIFRYQVKRRSSHNIRVLQASLDYLRTGRVPKGRQSELISACQTFISWNQEELKALDEEREEQEERLQMSHRAVTENKRRNAENRAKVSLVHAIVPFLDRIGGEVIRMKKEGHVKQGRRDYIIELVDQIDCYNTLLTEWIKMEQGQLGLHVTTFPLKRLFDIVLEGHYPFDQKNIVLRAEDTCALVKGDESLTLFMINTLADNARKFTPEGGQVTLSAEETEEYVEIKVTDTGCGLSDEDVDTLTHDKVYDAAEIGDKHADKGFGFGLMNCRGIIEKYKKTSSIFACCLFGVRSQLGKGSTFFFRLPRVLRLAILMLLFPLAIQAGWETELYDSVYQANVDGRYAEAIYYANEVLTELNRTYPAHQPLVLYDDEDVNREPADLLWAQKEVPVDYEMLVGLRNEVALAALSLHDWPLYRYNNRVCIRLHKFTHRDRSLSGYFHRVERIHYVSNLLLIFIVLFSVVILILAYKLLVRGPVELRQDTETLKTYILQLLDVARTHPQQAGFVTQTGNYPRMRQWAVDFQQQIASVAIAPYTEMQEKLQSMADEHAKLEYENNRLYVQNQVLDNCLSTIKHESMYYPSRIRLLAEKMGDDDILSLSELVQYYHHIYTLLCQQADVQVSQPGFKRQHVPVSETLLHVQDFARRQTRSDGSMEFQLVDSYPRDLQVVADSTLLDMLLESLLTGMMHKGAHFILRISEEGGFARFTLSDTTTEKSENELAGFFFPEAGNIPFLVAKQILREHDTYSNHPGCRLVAQKAEGGGYEVYFTLLIHNS